MSQLPLPYPGVIKVEVNISNKKQRQGISVKNRLKTVQKEGFALANDRINSTFLLANEKKNHVYFLTNRNYISFYSVFVARPTVFGIFLFVESSNSFGL